MRIILGLLIFLLTSISCKKGTIPSQNSGDNKMQGEAKVKTYLALGDSYTIGESVPESERWPLQLVNQLNFSGNHFSAPKIIARTGWTTDELNTGIDKAAITENYDMVSLLIGVNNQYRGRTAENFRNEFLGLLKRAIAFAGNKPEHVFVVSIPDWGVTPFAEGRDRDQIAQEIDAYNAIAKEESEKLKVKFYDITPISRNAKSDPALIANDGLHPSGKMYKEWVDLILSNFINL